MNDDSDDDEQPPPSGTAAGIDLVVRVDHPGWRALAEDAETVVDRAVAATLAAFEPEAIELSVVLSDDATVRILNRDHRGKDRPTNVLSFPPAFAPPVGPRPMGDVILALETVRREAEEQAKAPVDHLRHLVVHGVLHLAGYDHETDADAAEMEDLERVILARLGVADPYDDPAGHGGERAA